MSDIDLNSSSNQGESKKDETALEDLCESTANDFSTQEKQEARAFLRERFLRVITGIVGENFSF